MNLPVITEWKDSSFLLIQVLLKLIFIHHRIGKIWCIIWIHCMNRPFFHDSVRKNLCSTADIPVPVAEIILPLVVPGLPTVLCCAGLIFFKVSSLTGSIILVFHIYSPVHLSVPPARHPGLMKAEMKNYMRWK